MINMGMCFIIRKKPNIGIANLGKKSLGQDSRFNKVQMLWPGETHTVGWLTAGHKASERKLSLKSEEGAFVPPCSLLSGGSCLPALSFPLCERECQERIPS
jgi:hypothetical protein